MKYKFVKVKMTACPTINYKRWYLYCDNLETMSEHFEKIFGAGVRDGIQDFINDKNGRPAHYVTDWANIISFIGPELYGQKPLLASTTLENKTYRDRCKYILDGKPLLLGDAFSYMLSDGFEIIKEVETDNLDFNVAGYTEDDIRIIKWPNGTHFYAKIGNIDVCDDDGNYKWNYESYAKRAAKNMLKTLE